MNYIPHHITSELEFSDFYCGAGGSTSGLKKAGIGGKVAANHWQLAIDTSHTNHPEIDHRLTDLVIASPAAFPYSAIGWFSPECTWHAKRTRGEKAATSQLELFAQKNPNPAEERSRVTMWDVVRFSEYHRYQLVIVENVLEIKNWPPFLSWLQSMHSLGYEHQLCFFNSRFFHPLNGSDNYAAQNRDRIYIVFHRKGNRKPNLDFRPWAYCPGCGQNVQAVQVFKKKVFPLGEYDTTGNRGQYYYACPTCLIGPTPRRVEPFYYAAYNIINWSLPCPLIGERKKPLKPKTMNRIKIGLDKFGRQPLVIELAHGHARGNRSIPLSRPLQAQTTRQTLAFIMPFKGQAEYQHIRPSSEPLSTQTGQGMPALVVVPQLVEMYGGGELRHITEPISTVTGIEKMGLLMSHYGRENTVQSLSEPAPTFVADGHQNLIVPPAYLVAYYRRDDTGSSMASPIPTIPGENRFGLVQTPFLTAYNSGSEGVHGINDPLYTLTGNDRHNLVIPEIDDCGFRMLEPEECKLGQGFDRDYIILGKRKKDQVKQIGNAVSDPVAQWLGQAAVNSLY